MESTGFFQALLTAWDQDEDAQADPAAYGDPEDDVGVRIRRARVGGTIDLGEGWSSEVTLGVSSPYDSLSEPDTDASLVDAVVSYEGDKLSFSVGQQKIPYSRDQLTSVRDLELAERAVSTEHLVPGRETGVRAAYAMGGISAHVGLFNGNGTFTGDNNDGFLVAGRLDYSTQPEHGFRTRGNVDGVLIAPAVNVYWDDGLSTQTLGFGGDLLLRTGNLSLIFEGHNVKITPQNADVANPDTLGDTARQGGFLQVSYDLGGLEPVVRAGQLNDDLDSDDNGDLMLVTVGANRYEANDTVKWGLEFIHRQEQGGAAIANDTLRFTLSSEF